MLNVDREDAERILNMGSNLFVTGNAGAGKTYLIKEFAKNSDKNVALCATTGIAALNLGGETIHRFMGIGIASRPEQADRIIGKWSKIKRSKKPWDKAKWSLMNSVDVIVIDEASMLRRDQFELIEAVLSGVKNNGLPFGGVQIILVGDFCQLPPVVTTQDRSRYPDLAEPYCFQSDMWNYCNFKSINLTTNYRQSDTAFLNVLDSIRRGEVTQEVDTMMSSCVGRSFNGDIKAIRLFPFKADVAKDNISCLKKLPAPKFLSEAKYTGKTMDAEMLGKDCQADDRLFFCEGAQVMMLTNHPKGAWVNGSMGIITGVNPVDIKLADGSVIRPDMFKWERTITKLVKDKWKQSVVATMTQYPFKLAWSSSIHRSQGLTLDYVDLDISNCFAAGQAYVALSRVKSVTGLSLRSWAPASIKADPKVLNLYKVSESE